VLVQAILSDDPYTSLTGSQSENAHSKKNVESKYTRGLHGRDHMVVGFTTTYAIIAYHH
jgi:hypothetical protein